MNAEEFQAAIDALDLSEEGAKAKILELNKGLAEANAKLLGESKASKSKAQEAEEAVKAAREAASEAEEQRLIAAGETEKLKAFYENQLAEATAAMKLERDNAQNLLKARDKGEVMNSILAEVDPKFAPFVKAQLESSIVVEYDADGKKTTSIADGDKTYTNAQDFISGAKESEAWKHVLKGQGMSGANAGGSAKPTLNGETDFLKMTPEQQVEWLEKNPPQRQ